MAVIKRKDEPASQARSAGHFGRVVVRDDGAEGERKHPAVTV